MSYQVIAKTYAAARANRDYREYLEWLDAGNAPLPADEVAAPKEILETKE
jgi:hypothetical protein